MKILAIQTTRVRAARAADGADPRKRRVGSRKAQTGRETDNDVDDKGSISSTCLRAAFTLADHRSAKRHVKSSVEKS